MRSILLTLAFAWLIASVSGGPAWADPAAPGEITSYSTIHSIGIEWPIAGDANHNATCRVQYRQRGGLVWKDALPLFRVDYAWYYASEKAEHPINMFAGSILFLWPDTVYEVKLDLADPDGGEAHRTIEVRTRPVPVEPHEGPRFHVAPGAGGGDGSEWNPFQGLAAAQASAQPGAVFLLHKGDYGAFAFEKSGAPGRYMVWKAAGDGEAILRQAKVSADHVWFEGLCLQRGEEANGLVASGAPADVVVVRNRFTGFHYSILLSRGSRDWYIADNVIVGDKDIENRGNDKQPLSGEGIELNHSGGHVVAYNSISRVADGFSYPDRNVDVYGNDIFDVTDDAAEPDRGFANVRIWGNRMYNYGFSGLSFQPMKCGPWYILYNQIAGPAWQDVKEVRYPHVFKFRVQDRFLLAHNTIVTAGNLDVYMDSLMTSICRNNLFISAMGRKPLWVAMRHRDPKSASHVLPMQRPDWRTDVDYNGYDWGDDPKDWKTPVFRYDGWTKDVRGNYFVDLASFSKSVGIEQHGLRVRKEEVFENYDLPATPGRVRPVVLTLRPGGNAVDAGSALPGINDGFAGKAPDLGAYELGRPLPHYGPRLDEKTMREHAFYWAR